MRKLLLKDVSGGNGAINDSAVISGLGHACHCSKTLEGLRGGGEEREKKNGGCPGDRKKDSSVTSGDNCDMSVAAGRRRHRDQS